MRGLVVVKYGSETVADAPGVNQERLGQHAGRLSRLPDGLIVVSSGSVMAGKAEAPEIDDEQVLAGLGSAEIVMGWKKALGEFGIRASQVLVTDHEIEDPTEGSVLRQALKKDINRGIVPIVNTNDKMSYTELEKRRWNGENDGLAVHIAILMQASTVFFMTNNVEGLMYEGKTIGEIPFNTLAHARSKGAIEESQGNGKGGMQSKLVAAIDAASFGIEAYIAQADISFDAILDGTTGTHIIAKKG